MDHGINRMVDVTESNARLINSRMSMLRKAWKVIPKEACIILYDAMILPLFDYCCAVWGGCGKTNRSYLDKLQRRAANIVEGRKVKHQDISATFSWPFLKNRRKYHNSLQTFQCLHQLAPAYLLHKFSYFSDYHTFTRAIKINCACPLLRLINTKAHSNIPGQRCGTHYLN